MSSIAFILFFALGVAAGVVIVLLIRRPNGGENARQLENAFKALAVDALRGNNEQFLQLARTELERVRIQTQADVAAKEGAIGGLVGPIGEALASYNEKLEQIELARHTMFAELSHRLNDTKTASEQLRNETASLVRALSNTNVRGSWGEL
jgi:DNA recombination protein RmuC